MDNASIPKIKKHNKAAFLDRDGTIMKAVVDGKVHRCAQSPDEVVLVDTAVAGIMALKKAGYLIVVVTNQGGIEKEYFTLGDLDQVHERMNDLLIKGGADVVDAIYWCPHYKEKCECRKPKPGMLFKAANEMGIDLADSLMIGDDPKDMSTAVRAGVNRRYLVKSDIAVEHNPGYPVFETFGQAVEAALKCEKRS